MCCWFSPSDSTWFPRHLLLQTLHRYQVRSFKDPSHWKLYSTVQWALNNFTCNRFFISDACQCDEELCTLFDDCCAEFQYTHNITGPYVIYIRGAVPPLNIIILRLRVLLATSKHHDSLPFSFSSHKVAILGLVLSSHVHSSSINLIAQVSNITLIYTLDRPRTSPAPTPHHPNDLRHSCSFIIHTP